jgi:hypothetical protein
VHGVYQRGDVAPFGLGAGTASLGVPRVPLFQLVSELASLPLPLLWLYCIVLLTISRAPLARPAHRPLAGPLYLPHRPLPVCLEQVPPFIIKIRLNEPMLCLYSPYSFSLSAAGGRAVPVRGIFLTVLSAWTKTRSVQHQQVSVCDPSLGRIEV